MSLQTNERHALTAVDVFFDYKDVGSGGVRESIELPAGSVIVGGFVAIDKVFAGGAANVKVGDSASANRYGNDLALNAVGKKDLTVTGFLTSKTERLRLTFPNGTPTAGKARIHLWYTQVNRADFTQGL